MSQMKISRIAAAVAVAVTGAVVSLGALESETPAPPAPVTPVLTPLDGSAHLLVARVPVAELAADSDAAVVVHVESVADPRWNSSDGRVWTRTRYDSAMDATPLTFRTATVTVRKVVFGPAGIAAGDTLSLRLFGDGTDTGAEIDGADVRFNQISGTFEPGSDHLVLLRRDVFPMETEAAEWPVVWQLANHGFASWEVDPDGAAVQAVTGDVTHASALVRRIRTVQPPG